MKSFIQYLAESIKENFYAVKLAMEPTPEQVKTIENYLSKYDLIKISKPTEVMYDKIDFYDNYKHKDVWKIEFVTGMPISPYTVLQELKAALGVPEDHIIVRGSNEPYELEADDCEFDCETSADAESKDLHPAARLSTDRFYDDAEQPLLTDVFGDEYNKKLLDYLRSVADDRQPDHYEAPQPLFSWLDMNKVMDEQAVEADDFNKQFDTPKPVTAGKGKDVPPVDPIRLGRNGNFDDGAANKIKMYKNDAGKRETVSATRARLKAEKVR